MSSHFALVPGRRAAALLAALLIAAPLCIAVQARADAVTPPTWQTPIAKAGAEYARLQREAFDQRMSYDELIKNDYKKMMTAFDAQWQSFNDTIGSILFAPGTPAMGAFADIITLMHSKIIVKILSTNIDFFLRIVICRRSYFYKSFISRDNEITFETFIW